MERAQIEGFISLLQDDSESIQQKLVSHARRLGPVGQSILREASTHQDPSIAARARQILHDLRESELWQELLTLAESGSPDLFRFHAALSELSDAHADRQVMASLLGQFAAAVRRELPPQFTAHQAAHILAQVLHGAAGFTGTTRDYYDPRNSHLGRVLERRVGIPISLAAVYILVGRAAGIDVQGVGMPFHFLARVVVGDEAVLIDPFRDGRITTREDCKILLAGFQQSFRDEYLRSVTDRELLLRALANLLRIHQQAEDESQANRCRALIERLQAPMA